MRRRAGGEERRVIPGMLVAVRRMLRGFLRPGPVAALLILRLFLIRAARFGVARTFQCVINSAHYLSPISPERRNAAPTSSTSVAALPTELVSSRIASGDDAPSPCE